MKNYSEMSDFDINELVAKAIGISHETYPDFSPEPYVWSEDSKAEFNPCNNQSDAWPIILNNRISMVWDCAEDSSAEWWNAVAQFDECSIQYQSNPLRAAMIVYLMMKDNENEN